MDNKLIVSLEFDRHLDASALLTRFEELRIGNELRIKSYHERDCCEYHYLDFEHFPVKEIREMGKIIKINITGVDGMGINIRFFNDKGLEKCIFVAGRGDNNGYYSDELVLIVSYDGEQKEYDITKYQDRKGY